MKIAVIGHGLQSYVAAALFASVGNQVVIFEPQFIQDIASKEPNLLALIEYQQQAGRLTLLTESIASKQQDNFIFDYVLFAEVFPHKALLKYQSLLLSKTNKSSVFIIMTPSEIGEAEKFSALLNQNLAKQDPNADDKKSIAVCSVPLLVREGCAIDDFSRPQNIIVGCDNEAVLKQVKNLFYPFNRVKNVIKEVSTKEAEFSCFATNAMLATRLSFMNEMASLAERTNVDIELVRECMGSDPRIGRDYLYPGCGYGGHALEANVAKVASELKMRGDDLGLLDTVAKINERQKDLLFRKVWNFFDTDLMGKTVAIWGASFKPGTDNIKGAPAIMLINALLAQGANVVAYDPMANHKLKQLFSKAEKSGSLQVVNSQTETIQDADILAICTEWKEFWSPDFSELAIKLRHKAIFDGRNLFDPQLVKSKGLKYFAVGRS